MDQDATWYGGRPQTRLYCARWGPSFLSGKKGGASPNFRPMSIVAKRPHGSRCHLVWRWASTQATLCYMGTQLPSHKGAEPSILGHVYQGQTAGWIKMPLGMEVGLGPGLIVLDGNPAPVPKRRGHNPPSFRPMSIVAKRSPISATAEHVFSISDARRTRYSSRH